MSPVVKKRKVTRNASRRPLANADSANNQTEILSSLVEIFNNSQHVTTSDQALTQLQKLYQSSDFTKFEEPFMNCLRKLLQSKQTIYFKTSCEFLCKFLQHCTKNLKDDRLVRSSIDVADHYMQVASEDCRLNAVFFVGKFLHHVESLDEQICVALKNTLPKRFRDKKPSIRAQAVLASRKFQEYKLIQEGFQHHFAHDPELIVRRALLQTMDTEIFGNDFLVESTQDSHEAIRKTAFLRLGRVSPNQLTALQLHNVLHNGLCERERQAAYSFRTNTLDPWLDKLYDGIDIVKMLEILDVVNYQEDTDRLLELVHERDLEKLENNATATRLHQVVESFRERWLNSNNKCLPAVADCNERVIAAWLSLVKFCKSNQTVIKPVRVRTLKPRAGDPNESIECILSSQEQNDEVAELYERLTPDLVNLVDFLKRFVRHADQSIKNDDSGIEQFEFMYHRIMDFLLTYEVGDEIERKTVQEVLGLILKENLLTGRFMNFIPPIIKCLFTLVYSKSSNLMINYISELINNVRSHLEDLSTPTHQPMKLQSAITSSGKTPGKNPKKVSINKELPTRASLLPQENERNLEYKIATIRIELEELHDKLNKFIELKDFDQAKISNQRIDDLKAELNMLQDRRYSIASDVSHMSLILDEEPDDNKLSSTLLPTNNDEDQDQTLSEPKDDVKIFKHNTNELIKCLQMYLACLQNVKVSEVPVTMRNHLSLLTFECLDEWFKSNTRVRSLMVACNGLTALVDKEFAKDERTQTLLISACYNNSLDLRTVGFKSLVDAMIEHEDLEVPIDKLESFLKSSLRDYGKYHPTQTKKSELDFMSAIIEGTTKLYYYKRLDSPEIFSHLILWWYHPRTNSRLTQFIGVFLPMFVKDLSRRKNAEDDWLEELLANTFVISIEYLHDYIRGPGYNFMAEPDMHSLISFLCNLVPISHHPRVSDVVDKRIDDLTDDSASLIKFLKQSKNGLTCLPTPQANDTLKRDTDDCHSPCE